MVWEGSGMGGGGGGGVGMGWGFLFVVCHFLFSCCGLDCMYASE